MRSLTIVGVLIVQGVIGSTASAVALFGQLTDPAAGSTGSTIALGSALTSMAGFLAYLVRKLADGQLVSVDVVERERRYEAKIDELAELVSKVGEALALALEREANYRRMVWDRNHTPPERESAG